MDAKHRLQSDETDIILNTIDELRSQGIGNILELPQIIVCGDQSSGKSSVLNAVSTLQFPTKDGLCTRFATEVIMRPGSTHISVSIVPGSERTSEEKRKLENFCHKKVTMNDIEKLIQEAALAMGIDPNDHRAKRFSDDILRFEVYGPDQPSLTLVDLPGLFFASSKYQTEEDKDSVRDLVLKYMKNKRSVILAVISAKADFVLQAVTEYSRRVDPEGVRTLGVITKPDKLDVGSESEKNFIELADNNLARLHRGWHVLVNRDHNTRSYTQDQRDDAEKLFLSSGVWGRLPSNNKGVFTLRSKLSTLLRDQILEQLPDLLKETEQQITGCKARLAVLGVSRKTPEERRNYLTQAAQTFNIIMRSCINGSYDDRFFHSDNAEIQYEKQLRAVVQNSLLEYSDIMYEFGHAKHIIENDPAEKSHKHPRQIAQREFEDEVMELMKRSRGRELIGTSNPMVVRDLFTTQSKPWVTITDDYRRRILEAARRTIDHVLQYATDQITNAKLKCFVIEPALEQVLASLDEMIKKLLHPRLDSHPITYNRGLAESMQKATVGRAQKIIVDQFNRAVQTRREVVSKDTVEYLLQVIQSVAPRPENLARFAASEAIDRMRAYYKISKETLVDSFANLAIEDCLISKLPDLLSPESISKLPEETVNEIASETEEAALERFENGQKLELCESALSKLKKLDTLRSIALRSILPQISGPAAGLESISIEPEGSTQPPGTQLSRLDPGLSDRESEQEPISDFEEEREIVSEPSARKQKGKKSKSYGQDEWDETETVPKPKVVPVNGHETGKQQSSVTSSPFSDRVGTKKSTKIRSDTFWDRIGQDASL